MDSVLSWATTKNHCLSGEFLAIDPTFARNRYHQTSFVLSSQLKVPIEPERNRRRLC